MSIFQFACWSVYFNTLFMKFSFYQFWCINIIYLLQYCKTFIFIKYFVKRNKDEIHLPNTMAYHALPGMTNARNGRTKMNPKTYSSFKINVIEWKQIFILLFCRSMVEALQFNHEGLVKISNYTIVHIVS